MRKQNHWTALLLALPLAVLPAACGDRGGDDRAALAQDQLDRDLDLALQGDSVPATFQDTAQGVAPEPEPEAQPAARPQPRQPARTPAPAPTPRPRQVEPEPAPVTRAPQVVTSSAPVGTTFSVTLNETLSTETNRVGDSFTATLSAPIRGTDGEVVVPAGATIRGRLTQVDKSGHVGETAVIKLAFESVSFGGRSMALDGTVVRADPQRRNRSTTGEQVGRAAAGAAAGAVIGRVLGKDTKSTVKGAVIGAAAGTAIAMGTADVDVVLAAGSEMVIKLDAPLEVQRTI